jgi:ABC-type lipoprotein export system ATPase subunit
VIELHHVSKVYETADGPVRALDDLSLEVSSGSFVAIRGPSGCGKSTLLMIVGGMASPTSGEVRVAGEDLVAATSSQRRKFRAQTVGFVFQMFHLFPYLNVLDNVLMAGAPGSTTARQRAFELLDRFGLTSRLNHRPDQLSIGERQRVAIARALLNGPRLVLADEPTGNLDPENAAAVLGLLADYHREGGTVLLVTHEDAAAAYAQRTLSMRWGKIE